MKDDVKSFYWYKKGAEKGDGYCNNGLGVCYILGVGTRKNAVEAAKSFQIAANAGNTAAYRNVGRVHQYEKEVMDYDKAFYWYKKGAEVGDAYAYNDLGVCYQNGIGTIRNIDESFSWYEKAADAGEPDAMYKLGKLCENNFLNETDALQWYEKAVKNGNKKAREDFDRLLGK